MFTCFTAAVTRVTPDTEIDDNNDTSYKLKSATSSRTVSRIPLKTVTHRPQQIKMEGEDIRTKRIRSQSVPATARPPHPATMQPKLSTPGPVKKLPMNKVVVGVSPSPNISKSSSKIGSLANSNYKPGGGQVKIENRKLEWNAAPRTKTVNKDYTPGGGDKKIDDRKLSWNATSRTKHFNADYTPGGGDKKIEQRKLSWNVTPKVGSLDKASHRPGGGQVKIENRKLDWKVDSKVGSTKNLKHKPGGGNVQITDQKVELKAESKIGSLKNVKHRPGGGDKKIFNDKEYIRQINQIGTMSAGPGSMSGSSSDLEKKSVSSQKTQFTKLIISISNCSEIVTHEHRILRTFTNILLCYYQILFNLIN